MTGEDEPRGPVRDARLAGDGSRRRYRFSRWNAAACTFAAVSGTVFAVIRGADLFGFVLAAVYGLLATVAWLVPMTVVDATGIRTFDGRPRTVRWTEVVDITDRPHRLAPTTVHIRLGDGESVGLHSVGVGELPYLRSMFVEQSRTTPPTATDGAGGGAGQTLDSLDRARPRKPPP